MDSVSNDHSSTNSFSEREFGQHLRSVREAKGYSIANFAQKLRVTKGYISRLERGKAKPSREMIDRLAQTLETSPALLRGWAGYISSEVQQILSRYPVEASSLLRETFGEYSSPQETEKEQLDEQQSGRTATTHPTSAITNDYEIIHADCFAWLDQRAPHSIHAVVTDPPYGLKEYTAEEKKKLRQGRGGIWRIPPSFDGCQRSPLPRFTVLTSEDKVVLRDFFTRWAAKIFRVLVPGGHVFIATNPLVSHHVYAALEESGFEKRGEIIRLVQTLRGGDRPKNAHKEFEDVTVMPRSCWEPWGLFRKPCEGRVQDNLRKWKTGGLRRTSKEQPFCDVIKSAPTRGVEREIASHPSLKPQAFMRQIVRAALPLGEGIVLDPFIGGGSTIAAACAVGYRSVGIESDSEYYQVAVQAIPQLATLVANGNGSHVLPRSRKEKEMAERQPKLFE